MASVSAANLSTKAKIDVSSLPAFSEEVISSKNPRSWNDLPEHILLKIFDSLAKDDDKCGQVRGIKGICLVLKGG